MLALTLNADWDPREGANLSEDELKDRCPRDARQAWRNPRWELASRALPKIDRPDDVIIKVYRAGIARSNCKMGETDGQGYVLLPYGMSLPLVPGHETSGVIVETGPAVRHLQVGDPVTVEALWPCGRCRACLKGKPNHCTSGGFSGFTSDGGMAEYMVAPARHVHSLVQVAERFDFEKTMDIGVVCEPLSVAYVGIFHRAGGFFPGASVAVFGCGPVGLAAIALARCAGAACVIAFDQTPERLAFARAHGADKALDVRELGAAKTGPAEAMLEITRGHGIDFAVEATGDGAAFFSEIGQALAMEAKVLALGVERSPIPVRILPYQEAGAQLTGMIGHVGGFEPVIALHASGRLDLSPMIDARYSLSEGKEAITLASLYRERKVVMLPQADARGGILH